MATQVVDEDDDMDFGDWWAETHPNKANTRQNEDIQMSASYNKKKPREERLDEDNWVVCRKVEGVGVGVVIEI